mgnify:CR=1 FL=1
MVVKRSKSLQSPGRKRKISAQEIETINTPSLLVLLNSGRKRKISAQEIETIFIRA